MAEIFLNEANQEAFPLGDASDLALAWLAAKASNERLSITIQGDYEWLSAALLRTAHYG